MNQYVNQLGSDYVNVLEQKRELLRGMGISITNNQLKTRILMSSTPQYENFFNSIYRIRLRWSSSRPIFVRQIISYRRRERCKHLTKTERPFFYSEDEEEEPQDEIEKGDSTDVTKTSQDAQNKSEGEQKRERYSYEKPIQSANSDPARTNRLNL